ncbi:MAG: zf-HC2 domain-containing protein [Pseudomonadota bacterium]
MYKLPLMINCVQFQDFILDYLEGALPARQMFVFEMHLKICRECRQYLTAYRASIELAKRAHAAETPPPPTDVPEDLVRAIIAARDS